MFRRRSARPERVASPNTRRSLLWPGVDFDTGPLALFSPPSAPSSPAWPDARRWRPGRLPREVLTFSGAPARMRAAPAPAPLYHVSFGRPFDVPICARRAERREVLHALNRTGKGTGGGKHRLTANSKLKCR